MYVYLLRRTEETLHCKAQCFSPPSLWHHREFMLIVLWEHVPSYTSSTCDRTGAAARSIRQSLNPAFPLENCTLIPDSFHQLQDCTLEGFLGKSKLSLKACLTPAVRFLSPVIALSSSSTAIPNHALLWPASEHLRIKLAFLEMHLKMLWRDLFFDTYLQPPKLWSFFRWGCNHWFLNLLRNKKNISYWLLQKK